MFWRLCHPVRFCSPSIRDTLSDTDCIVYLMRDSLTNGSLRQRFGIAEENRAMASRLIRDAQMADVYRRL